MYIRRIRKPFKDGHLVPIKKEVTRGGTVFLRTLYVKPPTNEVKKEKFSYPKELREEAVRLYDKEKMSSTQVAKRLGISPTTVLEIVTKASKKRSQSKASALSYSNGNGQGNYKTATYYWQSKKTGNWEFGGSKLEFARMVQLDDESNDVVFWTKKVEWVGYGDNKLYLPDFYIEYKDGRKVVEEIKPTFKLNDPINIKKFAAAVEHFKKLGYEYKVVTEKEIGIKFIDSLDYGGFTTISPEIKTELKKKWRKEYEDKNRDRIKEYTKKKHSANKERNNQISRDYKSANKEKMKEYNRLYYEQHKEEISKRQKEYLANNKEKFRIYAQKRRDKMKAQGGDNIKKGLLLSIPFLLKSHVTAHTRTSSTGKTSLIHDYEDRRTRREKESRQDNIPTQLQGLPPALREKCRRAAPGQGHEITILKIEAAYLLEKGVFGLISAGRNPNSTLDQHLSDKDIQQRYEALQSDLKTKGLMFVKVHGNYDGEEDSFLVLSPDITTQELVELGTKYGQDSVIMTEKGRNSLIYTTGQHKGERNEGSGFQEVPDADNYYTDLKTPKGHIKFTLNFDFETFVKAMKRGLYLWCNHRR